MIDREVLIKHCQFHRSSLDWRVVRKSLACWNAKCGGSDTDVEALPFSQDGVTLKRKRAETILINLALSVLKDAAYRPRDKPIATADVRLALRMLYPFMGGRDALTAYWAVAISPRFHAWENCHSEFAVVAATLVDWGYAVNAEFR